MKIAIIAGALAFILSVGVTMFFTGTFNRSNAQTTEEAVQNDKPEQKKEQNTVKNIEDQNNITKTNIAKPDDSVNHNDSNALEIKLEKYKAEVAAEKAKLESTKSDVELAKNTKTSASRYQQLAKLYSSMKVEDAASVLCELDPNMTERILCEMNGRNAGKIMGSIAAKKPSYAAKVSKILANADNTSNTSLGEF